MYVSLRMPIAIAILAAGAVHAQRAGGVLGPGRSASGPTVTFQTPRLVRNNVLLVLADDVSVADIPLYGLNPSLAPGLTPNMDALAAYGVVFETAITNPVCSATRALLQTGRYAFRTGIGNAIETNPFYSLRSSELTLPEAIEAYAPRDYAHAAFGKWHLEGAASGVLCPSTETHGYDFFFGTATAIAMPYCEWPAVICRAGIVVPGISYMPAVVFDNAMGWIAGRADDWFVYLAPQSPYELAHDPPPSLQNVVSGLPCAVPTVGKRTSYEAALQAFDTKLGHLIASLGPNWQRDTTIIFAGDNGTPQNSIGLWPPGHGKGSLFEGGTHVPLIIAGRAVDPALRGTRNADLVTLSDVYRTVLSIVGARGLPSAAGRDSVDLTPALRMPPASPGRTHAFAEKFDSNLAGPPYDDHQLMLRDARYKVIIDCSAGRISSFFDLLTDPLETDDLLLPNPPSAGSPASLALASLVAQARDLVECVPAVLR